MTSLDFSSLRRWPDIEEENLFAYDATDRLLLELAAPLIQGAEVVTIGDGYGAMTLGVLALGATTVRVHQDSLVGELALAANASSGDAFENLALGSELLTGATLVLLQIPKSLDELEEQLAEIAIHASPEVTVIAGGRIKHLTPTMNPIMQRYFGTLDVSLAQQKSRAFTLRQPVPGATQRFPITQPHRDLGLTLSAHGAAFAGAGIDIGTRALLGVLRKVGPLGGVAIDLGCGTGVLAASIAQDRKSTRLNSSHSAVSRMPSSA